MSATMLLIALVPIIAFVIADAVAGVKAGVLLAISLSVALFFANWVLLGTYDIFALLETVFFVVLGLISLRAKNSIYFKFQPVIVNTLSALLLAGYQIAGQPFLVRWAPAMDKLMDPEHQGVVTQPHILDKLAVISHVWIYLLLVHAVWVAWAARKQNNWTWVLARFAGYPLLIGSVVVIMAI